MLLDRFRRWAVAASNRAILRRSLVSCVIVGTLLTLINQGDGLIRGEFDSTMAWRIGLTFLVPFLVATISGVAALLSRSDGQPHQPTARATGESHDYEPRAEPLEVDD